MTAAFKRPHRPLPEDQRPPLLRLISDYPAYWAEAAPEREAVVLDDLRWGYPELAGRVDQCSKALLAAGVRKGDRVATLSPPNPDYYVTFLAAAAIGAIWLGLNPRYQLREFSHVVGDARPRLVFWRTRIGDRDYRADLATLCRDHPELDRLVPLDDGPARAEFLALGSSVSDRDLTRARAAVDPKDPCLLVYTSGSTGRPKGALIHHYGLIQVARVQHAIWPVDPVRVVNNLPINHIGCVGDITCDALVPGGTIIFQEQFEPGGMLRLIERERVTFFGHVPTVLQLLVAHPDFVDSDFSGVQIIIWEGAAAPLDLIEALRARCPEVANAYGMTETTGCVTFTFDSDDPDVLANSVGWPVPEYRVRIADETTPVARGQPGEIQVKGDFVTLGYWNDPAATAELFTRDGWLRTGDLGVERPDGTYRLIGRLKEMFKSGGYNVYPREIEQVIEAHSAVAMVAVVGVPDPLYQEVGHAFVLPHPGHTVAPAELEAHCRRELANYKVPKRFTVVAEFPMLPIGKIDKRALKARAG